jgi:hypothetical protein
MGKPLLNFLRGKENLENTGTFSQEETCRLGKT